MRLFQAAITMGIFSFLAGCLGKDGAPDNIAAPEHALQMRAFAHAPGGTVVVANPHGDWDFVSLPDGKVVHSLKGVGGSTATSFTPDGKFLAAIANDKTVLVRRMSDGKLLASLTSNPTYNEDLRHLAIAPDGRHVAATTLLTSELFVWRVSDSKLLAKRNDEAYRVMGWTGDGILMANSSFRIEDEKLKPVRAHNAAFDGVTPINITPSGDGEQAAIVGAGVQIVNLRDGTSRSMNTPNWSITDVAWSPDKKVVALRLQTGDSVRGPHIRSFIEVRRVSDSALLHFMQVGSSKLGTDGFGTGLEISRDGKWLAIASGGALHLWDITRWKTPIPEPPSPNDEGKTRD